MTKKCKVCNGTYETSSNNTPYFHVCGTLYNFTTKQHENLPNARDENIITTTQLIKNPQTGKTEEVVIKTMKSDTLGTTEI